MDNAAELYVEEQAPANQLKGFTKTFRKRSKDKKTEDQNVLELLAFRRENKLVYGAKVAEKMLKNGLTNKLYVSANPRDLTLGKIEHYGQLSGVEVIKLDLDNSELGEKLGKPFNISIVSVRK